MRDIFEIAKSGLFSSRRAGAVTAHNISNANTPGYTRQRAVLGANVLRKDGFVIGRGVSLDKIDRLRNDLIDKQIMRKEHELGGLNEQSRVYQQIESVMVSESGSGLDVTMSDFFNAFSDVAGNPQDVNLRNVLVSKAQTMVENFRSFAQDLENVQDRTLESARSRLDKVNSLLTDLAYLNKEIIRSEGGVSPDHRSKDQQMEKLKELSGLVDIDTVQNQDGALEVRIGGIVVLNGQEATQINSEFDSNSKTFRLRLSNGKLIDPGEGSLGADIDIYQKDLPEFRDTLDTIAKTVVEQVNSLHINGYGLKDSVQRNFFNPGGTDALSIEVDNAIVNDPSHIAASANAGESGNSENARKIFDLRNQSLLDGQTLSTNIIRMISEPGIRLNEINNGIKTKESAHQMLVNQQDAIAGVSIDEELSDMIKFQNAYQASARVLNVGQEMYDTLIRIL